MLIALCLSIALQTGSPNSTAPRELVWATAETSHGPKALALELRWPATARGAVPVVLVVDPSGAGTTRERAHDLTIDALLARGVAVATTAIRTSDEAEFPAQVHDLKGAVRFLRANAARLGLDPGRIGVWGEGDGATLAALLGTSGGVAALEGTIGGNTRTPSRVQAVVEVSGVLDLEDEPVVPGSDGIPTPRLVGVTNAARDLARARARAQATPEAAQDDAALAPGSAEAAKRAAHDAARQRAPDTDRFFLGGSRQVRGFEYRGVGSKQGRNASGGETSPESADAAKRVDTTTERRTRGQDGVGDPALPADEPEPESVPESIPPEDVLRFASPRHHFSADDPPMFLAEAASAPGAPPSQARAMRGRLLAHGVPVVLGEWPASDSAVGTERLPRGTLACAAEFARSVLANCSSIAPIGVGDENSLGRRATIWSTGLATPATPFWLHVEGALPNTPGAFVLGERLDVLPGSDLVSIAPPLVRLLPVTTDARGNAVQAFAIPAEWVGLTLFFQFEYLDAGTDRGDSALGTDSGAGRVSICR